MNWIEAISNYQRLNQSFVLVTVLHTEGSAPRDSDAKMAVTVNASEDSIGGGQLEYKAIQTAYQLIEENRRCSQTHQFNLSQDLQQCCGGNVTLLFECFPASDFNVILFGAGHVGRAIIKILGDTDCQVHWIDSRDDCFDNDLPINVRSVQMQQPEQAVEACPADSCYLVMTHDHDLDQEICEAILARGDSLYCGLIGSQSKTTSFRARFKRKGFTEEEISQLTAPIGLAGLKGKTPMEIAVSVVAQILQLRSNDQKP